MYCCVFERTGTAHKRCQEDGGVALSKLFEEGIRLRTKRLPYRIYRVKRILESRGFSVLPIRSCKYPVDLLASKDDKVRAYCCKLHGKLYKPEMRKLAIFGRQTGIPVFIAKENGAREIYFKRVHLKGAEFENISSLPRFLSVPGKWTRETAKQPMKRVVISCSVRVER